MSEFTHARDIIKSAVDRIERLHEERKHLAEDIRDIYAEVKGQGIDVPALKVVVQRRAKDPDKLTELESLVETYEAALGTDGATRAPARAAAAKPEIAPERPAPIRTLPAVVKAEAFELEDIPAALDRRRA